MTKVWLGCKRCGPVLVEFESVVEDQWKKPQWAFGERYIPNAYKLEYCYKCSKTPESILSL
jgi:hypothetical protein